MQEGAQQLAADSRDIRTLKDIMQSLRRSPSMRQFLPCTAVGRAFKQSTVRTTLQAVNFRDDLLMYRGLQLGPLCCLASCGNGHAGHGLANAMMRTHCVRRVLQDWQSSLSQESLEDTMNLLQRLAELSFRFLLGQWDQRQIPHSQGQNMARARACPCTAGQE